MGFLLHVFFSSLSRCLPHAYPRTSSYFLHIHPSFYSFLSLLYYRFLLFPFVFLPHSTTSYDDRTWKQILPKPPPHPTTQPSFISIHTTSTNTPIHLKFNPCTSEPQTPRLS
ncbi:hypothetical protein PITC_067850 [Penicillium italicum]|uniref:Uncharacterized protein n=1 Tax=Penicillium italicum TaxID=40296 RepID=A0A0A2LH67_PENIT|nr:hypothetical protein PITC_067850 [Penicillium italicum]